MGGTAKSPMEEGIQGRGLRLMQYAEVPDEPQMECPLGTLDTFIGARPVISIGQAILPQRMGAPICVQEAVFGCRPKCPLSQPGARE